MSTTPSHRRPHHHGESNGFFEKLKNGDKLPMFTSCPGWIKHIEKTYPQIMPQVSTCGSPMEMFGAIIRQ